jgi:hypothetical protein
MSVAIAQSLEIANALIAVRYKDADKGALLARCNQWFIDHKDEEFKLLGQRPSRMLVSQLDLLDKAKDRVRNVMLNCL